MKLILALAALASSCFAQEQNGDAALDAELVAMLPERLNSMYLSEICPSTWATPKAILPPESVTGITSQELGLCAAFAAQIEQGDVKSTADFNLSRDNYPVEVLFVDTHGEYSNPPFAIAVAGKTLVATWRGSRTALDWASDVDAEPVWSRSWFTSAKKARAHGGYVAMVESELTVHEEDFTNAIKDRGLNKLLFTGHSLAGGAAQVANMIVTGRRADPQSAWYNLPKDFEVRSIGFAAPMTMMDTDADSSTLDFVGDITKRSVNFIYSQDIFPRLPGNFGSPYMDAVLQDLVPAIDNEIYKFNPLYKWIYNMIGVQNKIRDAIKQVEAGSYFKSLAELLPNYKHPATIIYYDSATAQPKTLTKEELLALPYTATSTSDQPERAVTELGNMHGHFPNALAY